MNVLLLSWDRVHYSRAVSRSHPPQFVRRHKTPTDSGARNMAMADDAVAIVIEHTNENGDAGMYKPLRSLGPREGQPSSTGGWPRRCSCDSTGKRPIHTGKRPIHTE